MSTHSITAEEFARVVAKVYEPDLDWDTPAEYDLTDREELTATAEKVLARLAWSGFVVQRIDDLALDEFDPAPSLEAAKAETTNEPTWNGTPDRVLPRHLAKSRQKVAFWTAAEDEHRRGLERAENARRRNERDVTSLLEEMDRRDIPADLAPETEGDAK